jgi:hypothetical protein
MLEAIMKCWEINNKLSIRWEKERVEKITINDNFCANSNKNKSLINYIS